MHDVGQLPHDIAEVGVRFFRDRLSREVVNRIGRRHIETAGTGLRAEAADSCSNIQNASGREIILGQLKVRAVLGERSSEQSDVTQFYPVFHWRHRDFRRAMLTPDRLDPIELCPEKRVDATVRAGSRRMHRKLDSSTRE